VTTDIQLRDVVESDFPVFYANQGDDVSARMAAFGTRDPDARAYAARWTKGLADDSQTAKTIVQGGQVVGFVATWLLEGKPQVTYWIARAHWGRGIATEALSRLLQCVTTRPIYASAAKDNVASLRVLEKCGFRICGSGSAFSSVRGAEVEEVFLELHAD
jgi:RimJ/RimL family protein N-acetyltransferase